MVYETDTGAPTGIIRVYDSAGHLSAAFDGTTNQIANYRPIPAP